MHAIIVALMPLHWLPWQRPSMNHKRRSGSIKIKFTQIQYLPFGETIVKIGPVDTEIFSVDLEKGEIVASKIYSAVGKFAQRAE